MATRRAISIIHYDTKRVPDDRPGAGDDANADFDEVRNRLIDTLSRHGSVGPDFRKKKIYGKSDNWAYFVVESIYNSERYHYIEVLRPEGVTRPWLRDVMRFLRTAPYWGVCVCNIAGGYMIIFADRLMVNGPTFAGCDQVKAVVDRLRETVAVGRMIDTCTGDASLRKLAAVSGIEERPVALRNLNRVTDSGLATLGRLKGATVLNLADSKITDAGLGHLSELPNLETLYLDNCGISDESIACLAGLPSLKTLDLSGTRVTSRGIKRLKRALPDCEVRKDK